MSTKSPTFNVFTVELDGVRKFEGLSRREAMGRFDVARATKAKTQTLRFLVNGRATITLGEGTGE